MNVWIVSRTDRTGIDESTLFGAYSTEDKAMAAILYWMFEDCDETAESINDDSITTEYVTDKSIWRIEKVELDFVI